MHGRISATLHLLTLLPLLALVGSWIEPVAGRLSVGRQIRVRIADIHIAAAGLEEAALHISGVVGVAGDLAIDPGVTTAAGNRFHDGIARAERNAAPAGRAAPIGLLRAIVAVGSI